MGGTPHSALAFLGFSSCDLEISVIKDIMRGCIAKLEEAGACLVGGHSIEDRELKLGLAVTGSVRRNTILKLDSASPGNILILTKPLGTGILASAFKRGKIGSAVFKRAILSMLQLNMKASRTAVLSGAEAATDITGFGLLGHGLNMAKGSRVDLVFFYDKIPLMGHVKKCASLGLVPRGAKRNLDFCRKDVLLQRNISRDDLLILSDPQTSGGLLISLPEEKAGIFTSTATREKMPFWIIGEVKKGKGRIYVT